MNKKIKIIVSFIIISLIVGCGMSKEDIASTVKSSMQETFDFDPNLKKFNLKVINVQVFKHNSNSYKGIASVLYKEKLHDVPIEITVDGNKVMWQAPPGAFIFIAQDQLKNLFQYNQ